MRIFLGQVDGSLFTLCEESTVDELSVVVLLLLLGRGCL